MPNSVLTRQQIIDIISRGEIVYYKGKAITSLTDPDLPVDDAQIAQDYPNWTVNPDAFASANAIGIDGFPVEGTPNDGQTLVYDSTTQTWQYSAGGGGAITLTGDVTGSGTGTVPTSITGLALSKLAALTADRATVTNGTGVISASSVTSTELGYVSGVTSAIQTQLNAKMNTATYDPNADGYVENSTALKIIVHNMTGSIITKGSIVYINGATGTHPTIALAQANTEGTSSKTIGAVVDTLGVGAIGEIIVQGTLENQNTDGFAIGDLLWLSPSTPGGVTTTKPSAPNHAVFIGYIARVNTNNGKIVYKILNGYELDELHNVSVSDLAGGQALIYDQSTQLWKNTNLPSSFSSVLVSGQNTVVANNPQSNLTLVSGSGISITTNSTDDSITISSTSSGASAGGSEGSVQYNSSGILAGSNNFKFNQSGASTVSITATQANYQGLTVTGLANQTSDVVKVIQGGDNTAPLLTLQQGALSTYQSSYPLKFQSDAGNLLLGMAATPVLGVYKFVAPGTPAGYAAYQVHDVSSNSGLGKTSQGLPVMISGGIQCVWWSGSTGATTFNQAYQVGWASLSSQNTIDIGLFRHSAGILRVTNGGTGSGQLLLGADTVTSSAQLHVVSGIESRVAAQFVSASNSSVPTLVSTVVSSSTDNKSAQTASLRARTSGTPVNGFGGSLNLSAQTSSTIDVSCAEIRWGWTTVDHSTRASELEFAVTGGASSVTTAKIDSSSITLLGKELRITQTSGGNNYTGFSAPSTLGSGRVIYTLPANYPSSNDYVLSSSTSGEMSWVATGGGGITFKNAIINGDMAVAQRGTSFTSVTPFVNNNDAYTLDRWYILSDGADTIDVTQATDAPTGQLYSIGLDVETTGRKFGIAQIIEQKNCVGLIGQNVSLSFKARVSSAGLSNVKAAILSWNGTADGVTSNIISSWNSAGTTPTFITNAVPENIPANLSVGTTWATYKIENVNIGTSGANNIIVFIWSDVTATTLGDFLYITDVQLERSATATDFERVPFDMQVDRCQRYCQLLENEANTGMGFANITGTAPTQSFQGFIRWYFTTPMRVTPAFRSNITSLVINGGNQTGTQIAFVVYRTNRNAVITNGTITATSIFGSTRGCFVRWDVGTNSSTITEVTGGDIISLRFDSAVVRCIFDAEL